MEWRHVRACTLSAPRVGLGLSHKLTEDGPDQPIALEFFASFFTLYFIAFLVRWLNVRKIVRRAYRTHAQLRLFYSFIKKNRVRDPP